MENKQQPNQNASDHVRSNPLLDCPFCGGKPNSFESSRHNETGDEIVWIVGCENCEAEVVIDELDENLKIQKLSEIRDLAEAAWNRRV